MVWLGAAAAAAAAAAAVAAAAKTAAYTQYWGILRVFFSIFRARYIAYEARKYAMCT